VSYTRGGDTLAGYVHEKEAHTHSAATRTLHSAETDKYRSRPRGIRQDRGECVFRSAIVKHFEIAMSASTAGMHYTLWNAFVVKAVNLLSSNLVLKKRWTVVPAICDSEPEMKDRHRVYLRRMFILTNYLCQTP
jgi:hypothetical protein